MLGKGINNINNSSELIPKIVDRLPSLEESRLAYLRGEPSTQDNINDIEERGEIEFLDGIIDTQRELEGLKSLVEKNLNQIIGIRFRNGQMQDYMTEDGTVQNINKNIDLDDLFILGQKFAIYDPNSDETRNVVCSEGEDGKMTYVYEGTNEKVIIGNGMQLKTYDENATYTNLENQDNGFSPPIVSMPIYRSSRGVTLCSRTARENLQELGISNPKRGGSAKDSFNAYGKKAEQFPPESGSLVDLYCDASPKNRQYGHRMVGVKIDGKWFVLDPYYGGTRNPQPADQYISRMQARGRRIWGGFTLA